ncbi:hypothetical protein [Aquimarina sp. 2201CG5-10]|uniref:hypothetical protein n=1 Tax=Aquimarina callyspongiae TaxID=3098150 RepID=UPI002AB5618B|nr:hypothetical protein [Aquimarina sp. 2201CG5-10]MDY8138874.1 hypothetical protein [Aquimarina sp. 2201CG5-10]
MQLMRNYLTKLLCTGIILTNISCENDSESDLIDVTPVQMVTYETNVKPIIDANCIGCHNDPPVNFAPMPLLTFANVKDAVDNRGLIDRVSSEDVNFLMPLGGPRLPQATIDIIIQWRDDGLLEQ